MSALGEKSGISRAPSGPMQVLIVPMYLGWLLVTIVHVAILGPGRLSGPFAPVEQAVEFAVGLAPYLLADYLIHRWRRGRRY